MKYFYTIGATLLLSVVFSEDCEPGFISINESCYAQQDIDVLDHFISSSDGTINLILDTNSDGVVSRMELCDQVWENGRIVSFDCGPIITNQNGQNQYNWINISGEIPSFITNWTHIEKLLLPYNKLSGFVPDEICSINLNYSDNSLFDLNGNDLCPPYPECVEDYMGSQSNFGTGSCELGNCYDVGVEQVAVLEFNGDDILNPLDDISGLGSILVNIHNDGPSCPTYPGLLITTNTPGVSFGGDLNMDGDGDEFLTYWYAIFAESTYFSTVQFQVSPFVPPGTEIDFSVETVTMGCMDETCDEDPYCHDCPSTPPYNFTLVVGEAYPNMMGDVNTDGSLNILDVILVVDYILYTDQSQFNEGMQLFFALSDRNQDYLINILDVIQIVDDIIER